MVEDIPQSVIEPAVARALSLRLLPSLAILLGLFAFAIAGAKPTRLLHDPDTYLHIAAGQWMLVHGTLPANDPFSFSMPGAHWIVHEWLSEIILASLFNVFGWHGIVVAIASCFGLSVAMLARRMFSQGEAMTSFVVAICSGILLEPHLLARPHLLALPIMVAWCGAVVAARDAKRLPSYALLPLMTLWSNLHGSFMVGLGLIAFLGAEAAFERGPSWLNEAKGWLRFTVLASVAAMLNPNGIAAFLLPFRFMAMPVLHDNFIEWASPNFHAFQPLEIWLLGLVLAGYGLGLKLPVPRLLFLIGLLHLGLQAGRHGDLLAILGPLLTWNVLGPQLRARMENGGTTWVARSFTEMALPSRPPALAAASAAFAVIGITILLRPLAPTNDTLTPTAALEAAKNMGLSGRVFDGLGYGGYLIFKGVPVFIDGRMEMYGEDFLARYLKAARGDETTLTTILDQYHIAWTLLEPQAGAATVLKHLPGWERVYSDEYAVIDRRVNSNEKGPKTE